MGADLQSVEDEARRFATLVASVIALLAAAWAPTDLFFYPPVSLSQGFDPAWLVAVIGGVAGPFAAYVRERVRRRSVRPDSRVLTYTATLGAAVREDLPGAQAIASSMIAAISGFAMAAAPSFCAMAVPYSWSYNRPFTLVLILEGAVLMAINFPTRGRWERLLRAR